ncbi:Dolichyl-phosphate-mannose-protein mannosyltransferase [Gimesia alba]|uniref:Dolichyl-phosphate-mannose-protein mannosyltransferase n=1 Tax=Gimesia alba TaxID=2527973 RepID=A0A517RML0_9PLAN|nr:glycosyltransferase family 39 protein [Gimesia alba]QDT45121.1 Dolichyl-phosphate-mannose-protein mannosyltransferase [Gimesia alba]
MPPINPTSRNNTTIPRHELIAIVAIILIGCLLRCLFLSGDAIEHFDEGVYASNLWFGIEQGAEYPGRYYYAPPLFPFLIEWSMIFLGSGSWGTFLPSLLLGILTVPVVWWVARNWFGSAAGLVAASLASLSDLHLIYSRAALTDVGLGFCLLLGVYLIWKSDVSPGWKWPVLAGITIGAGWAIKYNGWLPLAVGLSGLIPWLLIYRHQLSHKTTLLLRWAVITGIAFLVWLPVLIGLQKWGGYSVVAANHSRYVVGFSGWYDSFTRQLQNHRLLEGTSNIAGIGLVSLILCLLFVRWFTSRNMTADSKKSESGKTRFTWNPILGGVLAALPLLGAALIGVSPVLGLLAVAGIFLQLFFAGGSFRLVQGGEEGVQTESPSPAVNQSLAAWLLAAWFCGLLLATPLYYPYPRLTIPLTMSAWLGAAAFAGWLEQRCIGTLFSSNTQTAKPSKSLAAVLPGVAVVVFTLILVVSFKPWTVAAWKPRDGLAIIARNMLADLKSERGSSASDSILYIYAEPGLFFNLKSQGHQLTGPVADFHFLDSRPANVPVYLIAGPHAAADTEFQKKFDPVRDRFELVKSYDYTPSLLVRLNQSHLGKKNESEPVRLYRAK